MVLNIQEPVMPDPVTTAKAHHDTQVKTVMGRMSELGDRLEILRAVAPWSLNDELKVALTRWETEIASAIGDCRNFLDTAALRSRKILAGIAHTHRTDGDLDRLVADDKTVDAVGKSLGVRVISDAPAPRDIYDEENWRPTSMEGDPADE